MVALLLAALAVHRLTASESVPALGGDLPPHPRLLANSERWAALQAQTKTDPVSKRLATAVHALAEHALAQPPVRYEKQGRRLLRPVREGMSRIVVLSMAARLGGDGRFRLRAIAEMRAAAALPDWNPSHFLDTAEMTFGLAIGYDWLFEWLAPEDRLRIAEAIVRKGLVPSFPEDGRSPGWAEAKNNWTQVCNSGLVAGALAVAPHGLELGQRVLQRALATLPAAAQLAYAPDGAYPEGPSYWSYGTTYHVILADLLQQMFGSTFGTDSYAGFRESARYVNQMTSPSGAFFNYADNTTDRGFSAAMFWFARKERDRAMIASDLADIEPMTARVLAGADEENARFFPLALLWWDSAQTEAGNAAMATAPLSWLGRGLMPVSVHRSAWNDPTAWFVGIKGGAIQASHAHMDIGSFVLEAQGVRWAVDPGRENYHQLEHRGVALWKYHQDAERWKVFRLGANGHNILRFNGADQEVEAKAPIVGFQAEPANRCTTVDVTSAYRQSVTSARRTVRLEKAERVVIEDEWSTADRSVEVAWQWLTRASIVVDREGALLRQAGKTLRVRVIEPATTEWRIAVEETSRLMRPYDTPDPELRRLVLHTKTPARSSGRIVVAAELHDRPAGRE